LNQIGPLYWDIIQPGGTFSKDTGSVWFTIQASTYIEGSSQEITASDSVLPVAAVTAAVLFAAFTGGASALAAAGAGGTDGLSIATAGLSSALVVAGLSAESALLVNGALVGGGSAAIGSSGVTVAAIEQIFSEKNTSVSKGDAYATSNPRRVWEVRGGPYLKETIVDGKQVQELLGSELTLTKIDM